MQNVAWWGGCVLEGCSVHPELFYRCTIQGHYRHEGGNINQPHTWGPTKSIFPFGMEKNAYRHATVGPSRYPKVCSLSFCAWRLHIQCVPKHMSNDTWMSYVQSKSQPRMSPSLNTGSARMAHQPQESKLTCPHYIIYCRASDVCVVSECDKCTALRICALCPGSGLRLETSPGMLLCERWAVSRSCEQKILF